MKLKYITQDEDRHGTPQIYVRRFGRYVQIPDQAGHAGISTGVRSGASVLISKSVSF